MSAPAAFPPPRDLTLKSYVLPEPLSKWPWGQLLAPWSPPLPHDGEIILVSLFADVFVRDKQGAIHWLNAHSARVDQIAPSKEAFEQRLANEHVAFLKTPLIDLLTESGRGLPPGRLYGLLTPLEEGGRWSIGNIGTAAIAESFAYHASRFAPLQHAPAPSEPKKKGWFH